MVKTAISRDGTPIAYEQLGSGPPLILVDGAFCGRSFGPMPALAAILKERFTVIHYDRRGRGDSGGGGAYHVQREIEDLKALADVAGGTPFLYGISSGAVLATRAVAGGVPVRKLALYEPPLALDGTHQPRPNDFITQIEDHLRAGRRSEAVRLFMKVVGMPGPVILLMRIMPGFKGLKAVAHTLCYDFAILGDTQRGGPLPEELKATLGSILVPTLTLAGGKSPHWLQHAASVVAGHIAGANTALVPGQSHNLAAKAIAPVLIAFFGP